MTRKSGPTFSSSSSSSHSPPTPSPSFHFHPHSLWFPSSSSIRSSAHPCPPSSFHKSSSQADCTLSLVSSSAHSLSSFRLNGPAHDPNSYSSSCSFTPSLEAPSSPGPSSHLHHHESHLRLQFPTLCHNREHYYRKIHRPIRFPIVTNHWSWVMLFLALLVHSMVLPTLVSSASSPIQSERRLSSRIVTTKYGSLRGSVVTLPNRSLQPVEVFLGIPYASPPVGKLRFMPPVTPAHWPGVKSAHTPGNVCPQNYPDIRNETEALKSMTPGRVNLLKRLLPFLQNQSEDCLYLNIYTPAAVSKDGSIRLPVLMFIHGESFQWNAGSPYDGSVLSSFSNLVVVTINYRLGVLGFFPALDGNSRGNFGLMDQVAALHWIQENIGEFGGDPTNVSILGHGHGAACVNLLMLSPMAKGLFHRAIMLGGSALSPWAMATDAVGYSRKLAAKVGCPDEPDKNSIMVDCLRQKSAKQLVSADAAPPTFLTNLGPTVDGIVIPNDPASLMDQFNSFFANYDLMFGMTRVGYYDFTMMDERHGIDQNRREKIIRTLVRNLFTYHLQEIHLTISNEYTDWSRSQSSIVGTDIFESMVELLSDATLVGPLIKTGLLHSKVRKNTYLMEMAHATERGDFPSHLGCIHGDDLNYLFGAPLVPGLQLGFFTPSFTKQETAFTELFLSYISNFGFSGNPNTDISGELNGSTGTSAVPTAPIGGASSSISTSSITGPSPSSSPSLSASSSSSSSGSGSKSGDRIERVSWPPFDEKQQQYLSLSLKPKVKDHYHAHRLSYWNHLIPKLHVPGSSPASSGLEHHLLSDHDDANSYEGIVRESSVSRIKALLMDSSSTPFFNSSLPSRSLNPMDISSKSSSSSSPGHNGISHTSTSIGSSTSSTQGKSGKSTPTDGPVSHQPSGGPATNKSINASVSMMFQEGSYSTALSVTIAVGVSLLILNVLVFVGMFYHKDRPLQDQGGKDSSNGSNTDCMQQQQQQHMHLQHQMEHKMQQIQQQQTQQQMTQLQCSLNPYKDNCSLYPGDPTLSVPGGPITPSPLHSPTHNGYGEYTGHVAMVTTGNNTYYGTRGSLTGATSVGPGHLDPKLLTVHGMGTFEYDTRDMNI